MDTKPKESKSLEEELLEMDIAVTGYDTMIKSYEQYLSQNGMPAEHAILRFSYIGNLEHLYMVNIIDKPEKILSALYNARYEKEINDWCDTKIEGSDGVIGALQFCDTVSMLIQELGNIVAAGEAEPKITKKQEILQRKAPEIVEKANYLIKLAGEESHHSETVRVYLSLLDNLT